MASLHQSYQQEENFRQTGKFKPINEPFHHSFHQHAKPSFKVLFLAFISTSTSTKQNLHQQPQSKWWRLYFEDSLLNLTNVQLIKVIENCFENLKKNNQLQQNGSAEIFLNVNGLLVERVRGQGNHYYISNLDYSCIVIALKVERREQQITYMLECYKVEIGKDIRQEAQFNQQIYIKLKEQWTPFYLISKKHALFLVKDISKDFPILELTNQNLQQSTADIPKNIIIIKNLSPRIISIKFLQHGFSKNTQPLQITIGNNDVYQLILYKINRIKYQQYKVEDIDFKIQNFVDQKVKIQNKKQSKTTPEKLKNVGKGQNKNIGINNTSFQSTNVFEQPDSQPQNKKSNKVSMLAPAKHLKISQQQVMTNCKESNLVPSELDYPASLQDFKEKQGHYYDDFENLLCEEDGSEEKQLALNDSFQQFEKKDHSVKNQQIITELNKRKQKQVEQKKLIDQLQEKKKLLMSEEKEWIDKNFILKIQIKNMQNQMNTQESKQIEEIKGKITELKIYEKMLMNQLSNIRFQNNVEFIPFGEVKTQKSSQSQKRNNQKSIYHSITNYPVTKKSHDPITISVKSSNNDFIKPTPTSQFLFGANKSNITTTLKPSYFGQSLVPHVTQSPSSSLYSNKNEPVSELNIYSSVPAARSFIQIAPSNGNNQNTKFNARSNVTSNLGSGQKEANR